MWAGSGWEESCGCLDKMTCSEAAAGGPAANVKSTPVKKAPRADEGMLAGLPQVGADWGSL